jgi:hypothetical protein
MCKEVAMKNITLSIDEDLLQAGREYAKNHNISFNALVRRLIMQTVVTNNNNWLDNTFELMDTLYVTSGEETWTREELYRV